VAPISRIAGVLLLAFIALAFDTNSRANFAVLGGILLVAAWAIYHADREAVFLDQFALALSIAGQLGLLYGIVGDRFEPLGVAVAALILQLVILAFMPNQIARTLAALFANVAWMYTVHFALFADDNDFYTPRHLDASLGDWTLPVVWLITWAPLIISAIALIRREPIWMSGWLSSHARPALTGILVTLGFGGVVTEPFLWTPLSSEVWGVDFTWRALFPLLSISLSLLAAYGAFRVRSLGLLGVAILGALMHLSRFYYSYGTTLIAKSVIMLCVGAALLAASYALHSRLQARRLA
jgi:hypothetical protein